MTQKVRSNSNAAYSCAIFECCRTFIMCTSRSMLRRSPFFWIWMNFAASRTPVDFSLLLYTTPNFPLLASVKAAHLLWRLGLLVARTSYRTEGSTENHSPEPIGFDSRPAGPPRCSPKSESKIANWDERARTSLGVGASCAADVLEFESARMAVSGGISTAKSEMALRKAKYWP
uniref:Uncharacterized protein n=1 Tax=Anopheles atroparvus TaxID=41427 RepID=A0A182J2C1_ANOAO